MMTKKIFWILLLLLPIVFALLVSNDNALLIGAAEKGDFATVQSLTEKGADIHFDNHKLGTALHYAAAEGHKDIVQFLLQKGADIHGVSVRDGLTPLTLAVERGRVDIFNLLLEKGAKIHAHDLHEAAEDIDRLPIAKTLLQRGIDVNGRNQYNLTPLLIASEQRSQIPIAKLLLSHGADVNATDAEGRTPLFIASRSRLTELVKTYLSRGARPDVREKSSGNTILHILAKEQWPHMQNVKLLHDLLDRGVDIDAQNNEGMTPLMIASQRGNGALLVSLQRRGANPGIKNNQGMTALELARQEKRPHIVRLLERKAYNPDTRPGK